jgi:hypothetical protein
MGANGFGPTLGILVFQLTEEENFSKLLSQLARYALDEIACL